MLHGRVADEVDLIRRVKEGEWAKRVRQLDLGTSMQLREDSDDTVRDGWESACLRYRHLLQGGQLAPLPPSTLRLAPDEISHVDMTLGHARFFMYDPSEVVHMAREGQHSIRVRWKMDEMTTPKWRGHAEVRSVLTSDRLLFDMGTWKILWHQHLLEINGDASESEFILRYDGHDNVMLYGSTTPFFAVVLAWLTYGPRGLSLPVFDPIAAEAGISSG